MSVVLSTPPPSVIFSGDLVVARFTASGFLQQTGVKSVSKLVIPSLPSPGMGYAISFGATTVELVGALSPDDSGKQFTVFPLGSGVDLNLAVSVIAGDFSKNPILRDTYDIVAVDNEIFFTAKKTGKGFDILGAGISVITIGVDELVKPNYSIGFRLFLENADNTGFEKIYEGQLQLLSGEVGIAEVQISDKLHSSIEADLRRLSIDQPTTLIAQSKKSCRRYYFEFAESYGETIETKAVQKSDNYTVLHGALSTIAQFNKTLLGIINPSVPSNDRFLKQGSNIIYTRTNQPQYLYFFNSRAEKECDLICEVEYSDGSTDSISLDIFTLLQNRKFAFNVGYDFIKSNFSNVKTVKKYAIFLQALGEAVSEKRTFYIDYSARSYVRYFLNWSSFGGLDSRVCYGEGETEFELFNKTADRVRRAGDDIKKGNRLSFASKLTRKHSISTGWLSRRDLQLNADFFLSDFKYRYTGGLMLPFTIAPGKIAEITDGKHLYAQKFEYTYLFDDHAYTEGDAEDSGEIISDFFFSTPSIIVSPSGFNETDPTVPSWVKSITISDINRWNSAANPSDLTNYYSKTEIAAILNGSPSLAGYHKSNWDTAFGWGNHAGLYQPLEDQRLSSGNEVYFLGVTADNFIGTYFNGYDFNASHDVNAQGVIRTSTGISIVNNSGYAVNIISPSKLAHTTVTLPTNSGILALVSQIPTNVVQITGSYSNPSWITSLAWSKITGIPTTLAGYGITDAEPAFSKNTGFNKNFGTSVGTVAEGNDSRINNGQTAYSWGNHASAAYALANGSNATGTWGINISGSAAIWGGRSADLTITGTTLSYLYGSDNLLNGRSWDSSQIKEWLGLPSDSNGYDLSSVTLRGRRTYNGVEVGNTELLEQPANLGAKQANSFALLSLNSLYGLATGVGSSGNVWMQVQRFDGTNSAYNLILNPLGGNIGIGTTSPSAKLDVNGSIYSNGNILANTFGGYSGGNVVLTTNTNGVASLLFETALADRMIINSDGNVGIGTNSPAHKLEVAGNAKFNGQVIADGRILAQKSSGDGSDWTNSHLEIQGTKPGIAFHYPGIYAAPLWMGSSGILQWNGAGFFANNYIESGRIVAGYDSGVAGSVNASAWFRSIGNSGWYNSSYDGGIYMYDSTWVRTFNQKGFYVDGSTGIVADAAIVSNTKLNAPTVEATAELIIPVGAPSSPVAGKPYLYSS